MTYKVETTEVFEKQAKRLIKKYASLRNELLQLVQEIKINPKLGKAIGRNCYKLRISISSKGRGKSGGARIITNLVISQQTVYLLFIYDKSEQASITDKDLKELLDNIV